MVMDAEYEALLTILGDSTIVVLDLDSAMDAKYEALLKKQDLALVPPQASKNIIHCKWVYKIKKEHMVLLMHRYKGMVYTMRIHLV